MVGKPAKPQKLRLTVEQAAYVMQRRPRLRGVDETTGIEVYRVPSLDSEAVYVVTNNKRTGETACNCPAFQYKRTAPGGCKHANLVRVLFGQLPRQEIELVPWKGKDQVRFEYRADDAVWVIYTHQKVKETGEVEERVYEVPHQQVQAVYFFLLQLGADKGPVHTPLLWELIIAQQYPGSGLTRDSFNGGRNRKVYFRAGYYPLKVLEHLGYIAYGSKTVEVVRRTASVEEPP